MNFDEQIAILRKQLKSDMLELKEMVSEIQSGKSADLVTIRPFAAYAQMGSTTISKLVSAGLLTTTKQGGKNLYSKKQFDGIRKDPVKMQLMNEILAPKKSVKKATV